MLRPASILLLLCLSLPLRAGEATFRLLGGRQGLLGNHVLQIMQLGDGRMAVDTESGISIWDGTRFHGFPRDSGDYSPLPSYREFTRLFADNRQRLWIKDTGKAACFDLRTQRFIPRPTRLIGSPDDFFADDTGMLWTCSADTLLNRTDGKVALHVPEGSGRVQDVQTCGQHLLVFTNSGAVLVFNGKGGRPVTVCVPYSGDVAKTLGDFSLVRRGDDGIFYQIRMGWGHAVVLSFDADSHKFEKLLDVDYALHTLIVTPERKLYVSCAKGYWTIDLKTGEEHLLTVLRLPDGSTVSTGFNTICQDRDGGFWLGSYDKGILYASPEARIFDTPASGYLWAVACAVVAACIAVVIVLWRRLRAGRLYVQKLRLRYRLKDRAYAHGLLSSGGQQSAEPLSRDDQFVRRATQLVGQNIANVDYSVVQLARDLCMERSGLYKKMTATTGLSPVAFIRTIRLRHAAMLLGKGGHTVSEVSELSGFSSPQYFNKCFQQQYGCRPSEFVGR